MMKRERAQTVILLVTAFLNGKNEGPPNQKRKCVLHARAFLQVQRLGVAKVVRGSVLLQKGQAKHGEVIAAKEEAKAREGE